MNTKKGKQQLFRSLAFIPGIFICFFVMLLGLFGAEWLGNIFIKLGIFTAETKPPISGIFVAIIIGMLIRNLIGISERFLVGISFSTTYLLRAGIVLLGLRLSLVEALTVGVLGIPLITLCVLVGLFLTLYLTKKMNVSNSLGTLIACGTSICGVTAIMSVSPVIKAKEDEVSYAVANITIFGLIVMIFYPFLANTLFAHDPVKVGLFLGTAIHDTAQVTGAALIYSDMYVSDEVINIATVTKLTRNLFIIVIIPLVSYFYYRKLNHGKNEQQLSKWYTYVPGFVILFLLFVVLRTIGDMSIEHINLAFGFIHESIWITIHEKVSSFGTSYLLGMAMAGVGLSTNFKNFKGIGIKPFIIGLMAAIAVSSVSIIVILIFDYFV